MWQAERKRRNTQFGTNCGRLPESPPTESEASLDVPPVRSTFARENGPDQEEQNEQSTIEKDFSVRNGTDVFRLDYKEKQ